MLGVGWTEMLVIGVVALIVIGPKDLPMLMNRIGKFMGTVRRMGTEFQREINRSTGLDQVTDIRRSITEPFKQTAAEIRKEFNTVTSSGATVPSGAIKPSDPNIESVVDQIHANLGMVAPEPVVPPEKNPGSRVESPAPAEAIAPVRKPRKPRAAPAPAVAAPKPAGKAAAPRRARVKAPKSDA